MRKEYPNLPLIEERFRNIIYKDIKIAKANAKEKWVYPEFDAEVFSETFPNTAGLAQDAGMMSGQSFTTYYITVMYEEHTGIYGIFQGNDFVYMVTDANNDFYEDLANHELVTLDIARERY